MMPAKAPSASADTPSGIRRRALHAILVATITATTVIAASSCTSAHQSAATSTLNDPRTVALEYARALFAGRTDKARELVAPESRAAFDAISNAAAAFATRSLNLAVGSSTVTGDIAVEVLTGTMCRTVKSPSPPAPSGSPLTDCVTNSDPRTKNPIFRITLRRNGHTWQVFFGPRPTATAS